MDINFAENILKKLSILYVESDKVYANRVKSALDMKCNNVDVAHTIEDAVAIYNKEHIDIIITEVNFPKNAGFKFISSLRKINKNIPIIVISSIDSKEYLLAAIRLNLIEYIIKPIDLKLLRDALFRAVVSLYNNGRYEVTFKNGTIYNVRNKQLLQDGKYLDLTQNEVKLLDLLIYNQNLLLSLEQIKNHIWENSYEISDEAFKSLLNRLRRKIGKETIRNVSGLGYILEIQHKENK